MSMTRKRILVVDDEPQIRRFMKVSLTAEGYQYVEADSVASALERIQQEQPDLVILDLGLPDGDGMQVLSQMRQTSVTPVLVLTARDEEEQKVRLLKGGANDYLTKPFGIAELMARVYVLLRDNSTAEKEAASSTLRFEQLTIDREQHQVTLSGSLLSLSKKEFALLYYLASRANQLVTQEQLLVELWGATHREDTHYLRIFISQLRKKLDDDISKPRFIETEPGVGYRFIAKPQLTKNG